MKNMNEVVHTLSHTARMLLAMQQHVEAPVAEGQTKQPHPATLQYKRQLLIERGNWAQATDEQKVQAKQLILADKGLVDLNEKMLDAAQNALEMEFTMPTTTDFASTPAKTEA